MLDPFPFKMPRQQDLLSRARESISTSEHVQDDDDEDSVTDDMSESTSVHDSDLAFVETVSDFDSSDYDNTEYETPSEGSSEHWEDDMHHEDDSVSTGDSSETSQTTSHHQMEDTRPCGENHDMGHSRLQTKIRAEGKAQDTCT